MTVTSFLPGNYYHQILSKDINRSQMISNDEQYINLSTKKRDDSFVNTPVWFAHEAGTKYYYVYALQKSGKVKRIRNFSNIKVAICNFRGKQKGDWVDGKADLINAPVLSGLAFTLLREKYGIKFRIVGFFSWIAGNYNRRQIIRLEIGVEH